MAKKSNPDEPLDLKAVAEVIGVTVATARTYRDDGRLPEPDGLIGRTQWWRRATIEKWHAKRPGSPGRPRGDQRPIRAGKGASSPKIVRVEPGSVDTAVEEALERKGAQLRGDGTP